MVTALDAGELYHFRPLGGFINDDLVEFIRCHRHLHAAEIDQALVNLRIGDRGADSLVELRDDRRGSAFQSLPFNPRDFGIYRWQLWDKAISAVGLAVKLRDALSGAPMSDSAALRRSRGSRAA